LQLAGKAAAQDGAQHSPALPRPSCLLLPRDACRSIVCSSLPLALPQLIASAPREWRQRTSAAIAWGIKQRGRLLWRRRGREGRCALCLHFISQLPVVSSCLRWSGRLGRAWLLLLLSQKPTTCLLVAPCCSHITLLAFAATHHSVGPCCHSPLCWPLPPFLQVLVTAGYTGEIKIDESMTALIWYLLPRTNFCRCWSPPATPGRSRFTRTSACRSGSSRRRPAACCSGL